MPTLVGVGAAILLLAALYFWFIGRRDTGVASSNTGTPTPSASSASVQPDTEFYRPTPASSPIYPYPPDSSTDPGGIIAALGDDKNLLAELKKNLRATRGKDAKQELRQRIEELEEKITGLEGPCRDFFGGEGRSINRKSRTARLVIENKTPTVLNITLIGQDGQNVSIVPGLKQEIDVGVGEYGVAVRPLSPTLQPCYGKWKLANRVYYATFIVGK